jgi:hypothetical protein
MYAFYMQHILAPIKSYGTDTMHMSKEEVDRAEDYAGIHVE